MKINFVLVSLKTGGGNRVVFELCNSLAKLGHQTEIICANNSNDGNTFKLSDNVVVSMVGSYSSNKLNKLFNIIKTLWFARRKRKTQIVILTDPIMSLFAFLLGTCKTYRFIQADDYRIFDDKHILRSNFQLKIYKLFTKMSYQAKIKYIFNSTYTYKKFLEVSERKDIKNVLVHPAVNNQYFYDRQIRSANQINIAIVARSHPGKGFIDFIDAIQGLRESNSEFINKVNNIYVISHDRLDSFNLSGMEVIVPNNDEEIAYYMNKSHIFVSNSWYEGFGLPPLEAMFCGCAVILTDSGVVNEYAILNHNCIMIESKNSTLLKESLVALIHDKFLRNKLSSNGSKLTNNFSWSISAKQLVDILISE
jgi:glycosyltransferase involved in cell wall biosynthesis